MGEGGTDWPLRETVNPAITAPLIDLLAELESLKEFPF
jgi:hypothetical protein